ncbi:MAG: protein kinase [Polyangiaceae bacterium]
MTAPDRGLADTIADPSQATMGVAQQPELVRAPSVAPVVSAHVAVTTPVTLDSGALQAELGRSFDVLAGRYEIVGMVGAGGMGAVYRARDRVLDEIVALKMLPTEVAAKPDAVERFRREVKLSRRVTHRNVARVFDIAEHGHDVFFTMELIDGEGLGAVLRRTAPLRTQRIVEIGLALAEALGAAHAAGVVHRDLKPDNVILSKDGRVVVTDFGIAHSLEAADGHRTSSFVGTPFYMAPEQVDRKHPIDARTDLYALGVLLYEAATGQLPWTGETPLAIAVARLLAPPPDPRASRPVNDGLAEIILKLMAREPAARYASSQEVADALALVKPTETTVMPPSLPASGTVSQRGPVSTPKSSSREPRRIIVLPLRNRGNVDDAYVAEGLTEDLTDSLSMLKGLRILSRSVLGETSSNTRAPSADLYEALRRRGDVDVAVEGSVQRVGGAGGRVRVTLRAVSVSDGIQLWAQRFEESDSDLLQVNEVAASAIAEALTVDAPVERQHLRDPIAVDLYLKARVKMQTFWVTALTEAATLLQQALAREPESPTLLASYSIVLARLFFFTGTEEQAARDAASAALRVAPDQPDPHFALASVDYQAGAFEDSARGLQRTLEISPLHLDALVLRGRLFSEIGPIEEAEATLRRVLSIDPEQVLAHREMARLDALRGRWDDFESRLEAGAKALPSQEGEVTRALMRLRVALWRGDTESIARLLEQASAARQDTGGFVAVASRVATVVAADEELEVSEDSVTGARAGSKRRRAFFAQLSTEVSAMRGHVGPMYRNLEASVDMGLIDLVWLDTCGLFVPYRAEPRFLALREKVEARARAILAAMRAGKRG